MRWLPPLRTDASPGLVPGTAAVCLLLGLSRWGSYLGLPGYSLFVTDVLVAGAVAASIRRRHGVRLERSTLRALTPVLALLAWVLLRLLLGRPDGYPLVRDVAPYGYALLAPLAVVPAAAGWERTMVTVRGALLIHLSWVAATLQYPTLVLHLPLLGGQLHVLELRPDFDGAVLSISAWLFLLHGARSAGRLRRGSWSVVALASALLVFELASRAAVIALVLGGLLVAGSNVRQLRRISRRVALVGLIPAVAAALIVPHTTTYHRLAGDASFRQNASSGTAKARQLAWGRVATYIVRDPLVLVFGVGFGPDYLASSGAAAQFEGTTYQDVRAPHDHLLNTFARLGLVGLGLELWLLAWTGLAIVRRLFRTAAATEQEFLCGLIVVTLLSASLVGVILESPFGAVPFFWAVGRLLKPGDMRVRGIWGLRSAGSDGSDGSDAPRPRASLGAARTRATV